MSKDKYYRILLRKDRDRDLIAWLEEGRLVGEKPGKAIKRKLYSLIRKDKKDIR